MPQVESCLKPKLDILEQVNCCPPVGLNEVYRSPESNPETKIIGIVMDLGTSNCKYGAIDEKGQIVGIWSIPVAQAFLEGGLVRLQYYSFQALAGLKSVLNLDVDFSNFQLIATVGIYPSLTITDSNDPLFERYGFSYASSMGARQAKELENLQFYPKGRQIPTGPPYTYETMSDLLRVGVFSPSQAQDLICAGLPDYILSLLSGKNGLTTTPFNALEYMGILTTDGQFLIPSRLFKNNFLSPSKPEQLLVATVEPEILKKLGLKKTPLQPIKLLNRGTDGPIIHEIKIDGEYPARIKYESTVAVSIRKSKPPVLKPGDEVWVLRYGQDDYRFGLAFNCGVTSLRQFTLEGDFRLILSKNKFLAEYEEFFKRGDGESEDVYFARLDEELCQWLGRNDFNKQVFGDVGVFVSGKRRSGKGPQGPGVYPKEIPCCPEVFYYLLKEETAFAARYAIETLQRVGEGKINQMFALGPILKSPLWQQIHYMITHVPLGRILMDNQPLKEPSLVALSLASLKEVGLSNEAETIRQRLSLATLPDQQPKFAFEPKLIEERYRRYLQLFQ